MVTGKKDNTTIAKILRNVNKTEKVAGKKSSFCVNIRSSEK